jgi:multiple sugar transport system substrate-binding protein
MVTRRELLGSSAAVALAGLTGMGLAGCGKETKPAEQGVTGSARFSWWGGDQRAKETREVIKSFQADHPGATISAQFSDWGSYWQKLSTTAAGGNLPDVMQMDVTHVKLFVSSNQLLALDEKTLGLAETDKDLLAPGTVDGKLYAVGTGGNMSTLMYNQTALDQAGMPVPAEGFNWDTLASYAVQLQKKLPTDRWVIDAGYASIWWEIFLRQRNKEIWTDDGKIAYSKDDVLDWFNYWYDLQRAGVVVPPGKAPNAASGETADSPFALGFTVLGPEWSNLFTTAASLTKDKVEITRTPTGGTMAGDSINPTMQWSISAQSKKVELANTFVSYLLHNEKAITTIGLDRGVPGDPAARKIVTPTLTPNEKLVVQFLEKYGKSGRPVSVLLPEHAEQVTDALTQAGDALRLEKSTPTAAADTFWDQAQKISKS